MDIPARTAPAIRQNQFFAATAAASAQRKNLDNFAGNDNLLNSHDALSPFQTSVLVRASRMLTHPGSSFHSMAIYSICQAITPISPIATISILKSFRLIGFFVKTPSWPPVIL
jgi:hypothetical protein